MPRRSKRNRVKVLFLAGKPVDLCRVTGLEAETDAEAQYVSKVGRRRIELDSRLSGVDSQEDTIHESIHVVTDEYDLDLDESTIRTLALGLHQLLLPFLKRIP